MRVTVWLLILAFVAICWKTLAPVYQFYAHRHTVPMLFAEYLEIPNHAPQSSIVHDNEYIDEANQAMRQLEAHRAQIHSPGISAAVAIDGELVWAGTSGWADILTEKALTPKTQFRIGSTSKALTATLLARMVASQSITLDTPLSHFDVAKLNSQWQDITPRQLASHMAGIPHYGENSDFFGLYRTVALNKRFEDVSDAVLLFDQSDVLFVPGEQFSYSSLGTVLLSSVIQEASGQRFQTALQREVLTPLSMTLTMPEPEMSERNSEATDVATFYWRADESADMVKQWRDVDLSHRLAGGGFISTPSDLVRLGVGFINQTFISKAVREQFWTPQQLNDGTVNNQNYAIGWRGRQQDFGSNIGTVFTANHGGVSRGAQSWLMVIPEFDMAVAVNINTKTESFWDFGSVSTQLVETFLQQRTIKN